MILYPMECDSNITLEKINECEKIALKIERLQETINKKIGDTPSTAMASLDKLTEPKESINRIIKFYETLIMADKQISDGISKIKHSLVEGRDDWRLDVLASSGFVEDLDCVLENMQRVNMYSKAEVVRDFTRTHKPYVDKSLKMCEDSFFSSLRRNAPGYEASAPKFCRLLIKSLDPKTFFTRYADVFYEKFKFRMLETKFAEVLKKTHGIQSLFLEIEKTNDMILAKDQAENMTRVIAEMLMADIKQSLSTVLMNVDRRSNPEDIAFIVALLNTLAVPQNKFEPVFRHLDDLREECLKLANNLLVALYQQIGFTTEPNKYCDAETFVPQTSTILTALKKDKECAAEIMRRCSIVSSTTVEDLVVELCTKCYRKIEQISKDMTGVKKSIYMINNLFVLKSLVDECDSKSLADAVTKNHKDIVGVWERECGIRKGSDITNFIDMNVDAQKRYFLPPDVRKGVVSDVSRVIKNVLESSTYSGSKESLEGELAHLFSGK